MESCKEQVCCHDLGGIQPEPIPAVGRGQESLASYLGFCNEGKKALIGIKNPYCGGAEGALERALHTFGKQNCHFDRKEASLSRPNKLYFDDEFFEH